MDGTNYSVSGRVAVLVDGENMASGLAAEILRVAGPRERHVVRRVYGDVGRLNGWSAKPGFELVHSQSAKNAADIRMVIDAMRLSYEGRADRFVIASSDSDFTQLAHHLRERGHDVVAVVGKAAGEAYRLSATVVVEVSLPEPAVAPLPAAPPKPQPPEPVPIEPNSTDIAKAHEKIMEIFQDNDEGNGLFFGRLAGLLAASKCCSLESLGVTTWGAFIRNHPGRYACDPKGPTSRVRLLTKKTGKP